MKECNLKFVPLLLLLLLFFPTSNYSAIVLDSNDLYISILKVKHFNDDAVMDTLIALAGENRNFKPKYIVWGQDTTSCDIPDSLKVSDTEIIYPNWDKLRVASNIFDISSDTLMDIILVYWGEVSDGGAGTKDTVIAQCIFGQHGLDTISVINTIEIDTFQYRPFMAMDMRMGYEFREGKIRNLSNVTSYKIKNIDVDTQDTSGVPPEKSAFYNFDEIMEPEVKIYPNPAVYYTNLELNKVMPGDYNIVMTSLEGIKVLEQSLKVETSSELIERLNIEGINTGFYILTISSQTTHIGSFKIIIVQ